MNLDRAISELNRRIATLNSQIAYNKAEIKAEALALATHRDLVSEMEETRTELLWVLDTLKKS